MKIAFPTDDGRSIQPSFGQATHYLFITVDENGTEIDRQQQPKPHHAAHRHGGQHDGPPRGVFDPLRTCQVVIAGGMGQPAYRAITYMGLELFLTQEQRIEVALSAYLNHTLENNLTLLHQHGHH